ncbi:MAG: hypothetical protein EOO42_21275 [Flavobacteriales bacterium]|nr:MAG: hypothetical protein EOO42_21275 [Flavobacteriales bacterium]
MDNKSTQDGCDDSKVDLNDPNELSYAAKKAGVNSHKYKDYAKAAGSSSREKIAAYINKQKG